MRIPSSRLVRLLGLGLVTLQTACGSDPDVSPLPENDDRTPSLPDEDEMESDDEDGILIPEPGPIELELGDDVPSGSWAWSVEERDLSSLVPDGTTFVGVTIGPTDGVVYLLDREAGIYALGENGAELAFSLEDITTDSEPVGAFTDFAAITDEIFAITAPDDGYLLNVSKGTLLQHFCYLPSTDPPIVPQTTSSSVALTEAGHDVYQITDALAYDPSTGMIWAQPRTVEVGTGLVLASEMADFHEMTGDPGTWYLLPELDLVAGGMAVTSTEIILAVDSWLRIYDRQSMTISNSVDLSQFGISGVSGMTVADERSFYLVSDKTQTLYKLSWRLLIP